MKLILILWVLVAFIRTFYNFSKLFTEELAWYGLSYEEKREKQFGEKHKFFRFVQTIIPSGSNILLFTNDGMVYYLARYYLYPTTVIWGERQFTEWGNDINRSYEYVVFYPKSQNGIENSINVNGVRYILIKTFKGIREGAIYKR